MAEPLRPVDADNHYYEALDAFTRHLDQQFKHRGVRAVRDGTHVRDGDRGQAQPLHPEPHVRPGHRARVSRPPVPRADPRRRRSAHAHAGRTDLARATATATRASPRWTSRDSTRRCSSRRSVVASSKRSGSTSPRRWRASRRSTVGSTTTGASRTSDRIIAAPMISLADPEAAVDEIDRVLERRRAHRARAAGAGSDRRTRRVVRSATRSHDPVWARLAEADIPVAFHLGDSGYNAMLGAPWGGAEEFAPFREPDLFGR